MAAMRDAIEHFPGSSVDRPGARRDGAIYREGRLKAARARWWVKDDE